MSEASSQYEASFDSTWGPLNEFGFQKHRLSGIYRKPIAQAMNRPVWEPPDIDITGLFDTEKKIKWMENLKKRIPNLTLRIHF